MSKIETSPTPTVPSAPMTIQAAREIFGKYDEAFFQDNANLTKMLRDSQSTAPLSNGSYLHALIYTDQMFRNTNNSFRMFTGGCGDGFLSCLSDSFEAMLKRLHSFKAKARVIIVDGSAGFLADVKARFSETLEIVEAVAKPGSEISHFIVCDDAMVRDELPHVPLSEDKDANLIKAQVYFHNRAMSEIFSLRFDQTWDFLIKSQKGAVKA
jgi:hypothetical protein